MANPYSYGQSMTLEELGRQTEALAASKPLSIFDPPNRTPPRQPVYYQPQPVYSKQVTLEELAAQGDALSYAKPQSIFGNDYHSSQPRYNSSKILSYKAPSSYGNPMQHRRGQYVPQRPAYQSAAHSMIGTPNPSRTAKLESLYLPNPSGGRRSKRKTHRKKANRRLRKRTHKRSTRK